MVSETTRAPSFSPYQVSGTFPASWLQAMKPDAPSLPPRSLRANYLSRLENIAQSLGVMTPTGTLGVIIPLLIGKSGNATWLVILVILLVYALILFCITQFSKRCVSAGSLAEYGRLGLGPWGGVLTGWAYVIAMTFGLASSAPSSAYYADIVIRQVFHLPPDQWRGALLTLAVVILSWWTAHRDIKLSTKLMLVIEAVSVCVMIAIVGLAMIGSNCWIDQSQARLTGITPNGLQLGLVFGFMAFAGAESVTTLGEESRNPKRMLSTVLLACLLPVGILQLVMSYCLVAYAHAHSMALDQLDAPFDTIAASLHLPLLGVLSSFGVATSYFACCLGSANAAARVLYAMANRGMSWSTLGTVHPKNRTPAPAIAVVSIIGLISPLLLLAANFSLIDCINYLTQLASFGCIAGYFLVCLAVPFFLRRIGGISLPVVAAVTVSLLALGFILVFSVIPIPAPPWSYLPYIFIGMLVVTSLSSIFVMRAQQPKPSSVTEPDLSAEADA
jgi:amino acid transporter